MATTVSFNNNNTWVAPNNDYITIECWGSGGGGGSTTSGTATGGGGGGGSYSKSIVQVIAGITYSFNVGAVGTASSGNANGGNGGNTWFNANQVTAIGGTYGRRTAVGGAGATGGNGQIKRDGGAGASGNNANNKGGGGGSSAGSAANGRAGQGVVGGGNGSDSANLPVGAGCGGNGGATNTSGTSGLEPGAGGGGSGNWVSGTLAGAAGKLGQVSITYNANTTVGGKVTAGGANIAGARVYVISSEDNNANNACFQGVATTDANGNWTLTNVPVGRIVAAFVQHNNATAQYTALGVPFVTSS